MSEQAYAETIRPISTKDEDDEDFGLALVTKVHEEITALLPELGRLHKSLRELGHTEHLGTIEDTIGYLSVRLQETWGEYVVQMGLGKSAVASVHDLDSPLISD